MNEHLLLCEGYGCQHEEGIDYPEGELCPDCPFWAGRERDDISGG